MTFICFKWKIVYINASIGCSIDIASSTETQHRSYTRFEYWVNLTENIEINSIDCENRVREARSQRGEQQRLTRAGKSHSSLSNSFINENKFIILFSWRARRTDYSRTRRVDASPAHSTRRKKEHSFKWFIRFFGDLKLMCLIYDCSFLLTNNREITRWSCAPLNSISTTQSLKSFSGEWMLDLN